MSSRYISDKDVKKLYSLSAGQCNICKTHLFEESNISEMAHIISHSKHKNAPRSNKIGGDNSYENLILLCRNCHKKVDDKTDCYSVEYLKNIKSQHELYIRNTISNKNSKDKQILLTINQEIDLQSTLTGINNSDAFRIDYDFLNIDIMINYINNHRPQYYPFDDKHLTEIMDNIIDNYNIIFSETWQYYEIKSNGYLQPMTDIHLQKVNIDVVNQSLNKLKKLLYDFLEYQRNNFNI